MKQIKMMNKSWLVFLLGCLLLAAGCASPRSFDPSEDGTGYQDTSYQAYQSCLESLGSIGMAASCAGVNAGGQSASNYSNGGLGGGTGMGGGTYGSNRGAVRPLGPQDPYFQFMKTWSPEAQKAQQEAWLALAAHPK